MRENCLDSTARKDIFAWRAVYFPILLILTALWVLPIAAQDSQEETVNLLERLYSPGDFTVKSFGPARWIEAGAAYTTVEPASGQTDVLEIFRYDTATGERSVLISAAQLTPQGASKALVIENYEWSADGNRLLIFTNTRPVWRNNTRGDYWVLDRKSGTLRKLGGKVPESSVLFAKFSPDGTRVAYVHQNNIYTEDLARGEITQLTQDGSDIIINGTTDWVYEEELSIRDGFRWSPDGRKVAYWQFDTAGVGNFALISNVGKPREIVTGIPYPGLGTYPVIHNFSYPLAGTTNSAVRIGVIPASGGTRRWMQIPGDPRNNYIARMEWAENSNELIIEHLNRLQNTADVLLADAESAAVRRIYRDQDEAWVDYNTELRPLFGGREYLWISEKSGWRHLYRMARDGNGLKAVTQGSYDIATVQEVDEKGGWIYFIASPENATQRYLYRTRLDGSGAPERLTPASQPGWHAYDTSPAGSWAFHSYSTFSKPGIIDLVQLPDHTHVRMLQENAAARRSVGELGLPAAEFFQVPIEDGVICDAWIMRPLDFDRSKKYPVLFYVYGGPWGQTVTDAWQNDYIKFHMAVARAGYVVASADTRGTPALNGRAWRKVIHGADGPLLSKEHASAVREILRTRPYLDSSRVAVWGWSTGGSNTLNLLFRSPELYKTGMSVAPMADHRFYDTIYTERYMGLPQDNEEGYRKSAPINFAEGLQGKLLILHGSGDDNCHIQNTELLVNRLIELGKPFDFFVYPNRTHAINEGEGTTLHLFSLLLRYLRTNVPAGPAAR